MSPRMRITIALFGAIASVSVPLYLSSVKAQEIEAPMEQAALPPAADTCETKPYSILVTVHDVRRSEGTITADLHGDDPEKFLGRGQRLDRIRVPATEGQTQMCIAVDTPGVYALALYHDEDADTKFDKNFIGLPSEPFGLSNDPKIRLAMPKHSESAFEVTGPLTPVTVTLRH